MSKPQQILLSLVVANWLMYSFEGVLFDAIFKSLHSSR